MPSTIPSPEVRADIIDRLSDLIKAIEAHPAWIPPNPNRGLFHIWDFVNRSRYILTEVYNIRDGQPVKHPEQIPQQKSGRTGPAAAAESFNDVRTRAVTVDQMISSPRLLTMMGLPQVDYGADVIAKSKAVLDALKRAESAA
ncbi:hypothetical protein Cob_v008708 [Colletotrichum orbiculare MAFF 240422]|uniref:Uncharacterized protein n=2 Tax=Colletotrichum orbiculare species complex TaxID=2707354 RepID=N4VJI0_COLOR|nr:hypothetical protein Cob_v008708 [Colletotrichum orbiculare MAFF 240422]TDZ37169.1 hypothetical protein C8035_v008996 [Colletotrichum spinosum]